MLGAPGGLCWTGSPSTHQWAYPAHTRGSFRFTTKGTKGVPGALPLDPVGGLLSSPQRRQAPLPPERGASSDGTQAINRLPRHGLTAGSVPLIEPKEKIRPICPPTQSGKSVFFVAEGSPARCVASAKRAVRDGYSFYSNRVCVPSLEPDFVRFPKFC